MCRSQLLLAIFAIIVLSACRKNENSISLPLSGALNVYYTDTFSVSLSTVLQDSVPTAAVGRLLTGHYNDSYVGDVYSNAFFDLSLQGIDHDGDQYEDILTASAYPIYDSVTLLLPLQYAYGDTLKPFTIKAHNLTEAIYNKYGTGALYNNTSFTYDHEALGKTTFTSPPFNDTVSIPLLKEFGRNFFNMAKAKDSRIANPSVFKQYFNGLVLTADTAVNNIMYGYTTSPVMRLYFHDSLDTKTVLHYDFVHTVSSSIVVNNHYNKIWNNRKNIPGLNQLTQIYQETPASAMNGKAVMLTGINLLPKLQFPYLLYLKSLSSNNIIVNRAQLVITPDIQSYDDNFPLPYSLVMYKTNNTNISLASIYSSGTSNQEIVSPVIDYVNGNNTHYIFEITDFVNQKLHTDDNLSLFLAPYNATQGIRAEKLVLDQSQIKLIIYLTVM